MYYIYTYIVVYEHIMYEHIVVYILANASIDKLSKFINLFFYFCLGKTEKSCIPGLESTHIYLCKMDRNNILKRTFHNILSYHRYMHESLTSPNILIISMFYKLDCVEQNYYFHIHIIQVIITTIMLTRSSEKIF